MAASCLHCDSIMWGKPLPCRACKSVSECMYDIGSLDNQHDHYELCQKCFHGGSERPTPLQTKKAR